MWRIKDQGNLRTFLEGIVPFVVYKEVQVRLGLEVLDNQDNKEGEDGKWVDHCFSAQQNRRLSAIKIQLHSAKAIGEQSRLSHDNPIILYIIFRYATC